MRTIRLIGWFLMAALLSCSGGKGETTTPDTTLVDALFAELPAVEAQVGDVVQEAADGSAVDTSHEMVLRPWTRDHPWTDGEFIRDEKGRVLILRGVNLANASKAPPFFPTWLEPGTFEAIAARGFNVVRFLIFWEAVEPEKGQYDESYLDAVAEKVDWAGEAGLYVILDMHQDVWGRKYGSDGAPVWATLDDDLPFEKEGPWWMGYNEPAVIRAFESFWNDRDGIRSRFVEMWGHVAARFKDSETVLGYDLLNEPFQGSYGSTEEFCEKGLTPLYDALAPAIRAVDSRHLLFMEPQILTSTGLEGCIAPKERDGIVYAPHYYDPVAKLSGIYDGDPARAAAGLEAHAATAKALGVPWFLGEWGFGAQWEGAAGLINDQADLLASHFAGWTYWSWDHGGGFSLMDKDGRPIWSLDALTRVFPRRLAGRPVSFAADPSGHAVVDYIPDPSLGVENSLFVPGARYPHGHSVEEEVDRIRVKPGYPASRFGLSSHVSLSNDAQQDQELDGNAEAGLTVLRRDFSWSKIEPSQGEFHFDGYDVVVDKAVQRGFEVVGLLDYGNAWAYGTPGADSTLDMDAFGAFAGACAKHFEGRVRLWEIWNEENTERFWKPEPDPEAYGRLLKAAAAGIRANCADCLVVFGGLAPGFIPGPFWLWDFLDVVYDEHPDLSSHFDILAIHPYTAMQMAAPEEELLWGSTTRVLMEALSIMWKRGVRKPLWLTEFGWPSAPDPPVGPTEKPIPNVSLEDQARYLVRGFVLAASKGVEASLWYTTTDGKGTSVPPSESYFGLLQYDPDPGIAPAPVKKPSWNAAAVMTSFLGGRAYSGRVETPVEQMHLHGYGPIPGGPERVVVAWSPFDEAVVEFQVDCENPGGEPPVDVWDRNGDVLSPAVTPDGFSVTVGPDPIYLTGPDGCFGPSLPL